MAKPRKPAKTSASRKPLDKKGMKRTRGGGTATTTTQSTGGKVQFHEFTIKKTTDSASAGL